MSGGIFNAGEAGLAGTLDGDAGAFALAGEGIDGGAGLGELQRDVLVHARLLVHVEIGQPVVDHLHGVDVVEGVSSPPRPLLRLSLPLPGASARRGGLSCYPYADVRCWELTSAKLATYLDYSNSIYAVFNIDFT